MRPKQLAIEWHEEERPVTWREPWKTCLALTAT